MRDPDWKKTTKREFLKIMGLSGASLLASGALADELLAEAQGRTLISGAKIPVVVKMKPNALQLGRRDKLSAIIVFPSGYKIADIDIPSVKCEGAHASGSPIRPNNRTIVIPYNSSDLRDDLPCGFSVPFTVTGRLANGSTFAGLDEVVVVGADQNNVYHTSTRRRRSCRACKGHAMNRLYSSRQAADENRAHLGCNCRVVEEKIHWQNYVRVFWPDSSGGTVVYDRRWGWPPLSPMSLDLEH